MMADKLNNRLSVVTPQKLSATGDALLASSADILDASKLATFGRQSRRSTTVRHSGPVNGIQTRFAMETASFTLYWGGTQLVLVILWLYV